MNHKISDKRRSIAVIVTFAFLFLGFIIVPFSGDLEVMFGFCRQADFYEKGLIFNSFSTWDLKGVLNRLTLYIIYRIIAPVAQTGTYRFVFLSQLLYAIFLVLVACICIRLLYHKLDWTKCMVLSSLLLAVEPWCKMQAEMTGVLFTMIAFSLICGPKGSGGFRILRLVISGVLLGTLFFLKSPMLALAASCCLAVLLYQKANNIKRRKSEYVVIGVSFLVFSAFILLMVYAINPDEFLSIKNAAIYQETLIGGGVLSLARIRYFVSQFALSSAGIPVFAMGAVLFIKRALLYVNKKDWGSLVLEILMWGAPLSYVLVSNTFFIYHYLLFVFPAFVELLLWYGDWESEKEKNSVSLSAGWFLMAIAITLVCVVGGWILPSVFYHAKIESAIRLLILLLYIAVFVTTVVRRGRRFAVGSISLLVLAVFIGYASILSYNGYSYTKLTFDTYADEIQLDIASNEAFLYLDGGYGSYKLGYQSYFREYYPLVFQRIHENSANSDLPYYQESHAYVMNYTGKYVSVDEFFMFDGDENESIRKKLDDEYVLFSDYKIWMVPESLFKRQDENNIGRYHIYVRKVGARR